MSERHQDMCLGCEEEVWRHSVPLDDARPDHPIDDDDVEEDDQ